MNSKRFVTVSILFLSLSLAPIGVNAATQIQTHELYTTDTQPRANITGYIYKIMNGRQWKRLWSYTYARWEEPAWTLA